MKIRHGFVSNSSSSSFILIFDEIPKTKGQLFDLMFPNGDIGAPISCWNMSVPAFMVIERLFSDLQEAKEPTKEELAELLSSTQIENELSYFNEVVPDYDFHRISDDDYWKEICQKQSEVGKRHAEQLLRENKGKEIRVVEYEDKGELAIIEHGDIFSYGKLKAIRIGNH